MIDGIQLMMSNIWFVIIGLMLAAYVVLDGFNLGVGILTLVHRERERQTVMVSSLGSVWDANATWLVVMGGSLFGAFPLVYAVVLHALYIPFMIMLTGLIFRAVSFEFMALSSPERRHFWTVAFGVGSLLAAISQGLVLGALLDGIPVLNNGQYAGGPFDWVTPFGLLVSLGVVFGYSLIGATYLVIKTEGEIQQKAYKEARVFSLLMLLVAIGVTLYTPLRHAYIMDKWLQIVEARGFLYLASMPILAGAAFLMLQRALSRRFEFAPFMWTLVIFLTSFIGLAMSIYPNIIPPGIHLVEAAASAKTLIFMLTGIGMLIPIIIVYNTYQYMVFRGKVKAGAGHEEH